MSTEKKHPIDKIIEKNGKRIDLTVAQQIVNAIKADGQYSPDEKDVVAKIIESEDIAWTRGAMNEFEASLSSLEKDLKKSEKWKETVAGFDQYLYQVSVANTIGGNSLSMDNAKEFADYIAEFGYDEKKRNVIQYLYNTEAFTAEAEAFLKGTIAKQRGASAHRRWVSKEADTEIRTLLGDSFQGVKINLATANKVLDIVMKDGSYSAQEKKTIINLYNNAEIAENVRDVMVDTLYRFTYRHGFSLDGAVLSTFDMGINVSEDAKTNHGWTGDREITMSEANDIVGELDLGRGLDEDVIRSVEFCIQTYPMADDVQDYFEAELAKAVAATEEKQSKELDVVVEKAEKEEEVKDEKTTITVQPSKTLMATYKDLRNAKGKITARSAQVFIDAIFLDGKYSKNEQKTMRVLRQKGAFTAAANDRILLAIRRFVMNKNRKK
jgi:hypothetical protein